VLNHNHHVFACGASHIIWSPEIVAQSLTEEHVRVKGINKPRRIFDFAGFIYMSLKEGNAQT
jgi:hypothetical protein